MEAIPTFILQFLHMSRTILATDLPVTRAEASVPALGGPFSQFWVFHKPKLSFGCPGLSYYLHFKGNQYLTVIFSC